GSWSLTIPLAPGTYGYKFLVNGSDWVFDPTNSNRKTVNGIENSAIEVSSTNANSPAPWTTASPIVQTNTNSLTSPATSSPGSQPLTATLPSTPLPTLVPTPGEEMVTEIK